VTTWVSFGTCRSATWTDYSEQAFSPHLTQLFASKICRLHLWLELKRERGTWARQYWDQDGCFLLTAF
jgi:hypothetical protein